MKKFMAIEVPGLLMAIISIVLLVFLIHSKYFSNDTANDISIVSSELLSEQEVRVINNGDFPGKTAIIYDERKLLLTYITPDSCSSGLKSVRIQGDHLIVKFAKHNGECSGSLGGPYHRVINITEDFANNKNAKVVFLNNSLHHGGPITIHRH